MQITTLPGSQDSVFHSALSNISQIRGTMLGTLVGRSSGHIMCGQMPIWRLAFVSTGLGMAQSDQSPYSSGWRQRKVCWRLGSYVYPLAMLFAKYASEVPTVGGVRVWETLRNPQTFKEHCLCLSIPCRQQSTLWITQALSLHAPPSDRVPQAL